MKRYDTHRNFPPARRPRDSTPAPPEDDELERLLTTSQSAAVETVVAPPQGDIAVESKLEAEEPLPSSVESALTAYVESLPASDPEPRVEEREIDVDAEAARREASVAAPVSTEPASDAEPAAGSAAAPAGEGTPVSEATPPASSPSDEDDGEDDEEPESIAPSSSRRAEPAPLDSIAATARSSAPAALPKRGVPAGVWIAGFALGGVALAFWLLREPMHPENTAVHAASPPVETNATAPVELVEAVPSEPAELAPPVPSASAALPAASAR